MSQVNRKYDGPPVRELRQVDQEPLRVPPHRKPRKYRMTVRVETVSTSTYVKEFTSKEAMREHRVRTDRLIAAHKASGKSGKRFYSFSYELKMDCKTRDEFKAEPQITEELIEG